MQVLTLSSLLLSLVSISHCRPDARFLVTPAPAVPTPLLHPRQFGTSYLAQTCGFIDAYILSPLGCYQGSVCVEDKTLGLAGGCCRLADVSSNCLLPTSCVPQASLSASCDEKCSSNARVTKCDDTNPYCYTNYWISDGSTPTEVGCTTTQGFFAYVYSDYTTPGSNFSPTTARNSPIPQSTTSSNSASGTAGSGSSQQTLDSGSDQATDSGASTNDSSDGNSSKSSAPVGAIAGGVVGGVAVIAVAAGIITWLCLRHRKEQKNNAKVNVGASSTPEVGPGAGGIVTRKPVPEQNADSPVGSTELAHDQNYRPNEVVSNDKMHAHELLGRARVPELP